MAEEIFSAYHVAGYVNAVAAAGKEAYSLPISANCWLDKGEAAGNYPTGGPISKIMEVWRYSCEYGKRLKGIYINSPSQYFHAKLLIQSLWF